MTGRDSGIEVRVRDATGGDVTPVVALVQSAYRGESSRRGWTTEADLLDGQRIDEAGVRELISRDDARLRVIDGGARLLACCLLERHPASAHFGLFAVAPEHQGTGIGHAVLLDAEDLVVKEWGCRAMTMTVIAQRADLLGWYERRGYVKTGERLPFPYGDERFGIPRRDDLVFEVLSKEFAPAPS